MNLKGKIMILCGCTAAAILGGFLLVVPGWMYDRAATQFRTGVYASTDSWQRKQISSFVDQIVAREKVDARTDMRIHKGITDEGESFDYLMVGVVVTAPSAKEAALAAKRVSGALRQECEDSGVRIHFLPLLDANSVKNLPVKILLLAGEGIGGALLVLGGLGLIFFMGFECITMTSRNMPPELPREQKEEDLY